MGKWLPDISVLKTWTTNPRERRENYEQWLRDLPSVPELPKTHHPMFDDLHGILVEVHVLDEYECRLFREGLSINEASNRNEESDYRYSPDRLMERNDKEKDFIREMLEYSGTINDGVLEEFRSRAAATFQIYGVPMA